MDSFGWSTALGGLGGGIVDVTAAARRRHVPSTTGWRPSVSGCTARGAGPAAAPARHSLLLKCFLDYFKIFVFVMLSDPPPPVGTKLARTPVGARVKEKFTFTKMLP